jgi:hypothetical protein
MQRDAHGKRFELIGRKADLRHVGQRGAHGALHGLGRLAAPLPGSESVSGAV